MVGIVVVSHSEALAEGVVRLAREMAGEELALVAAGGIEEPGVLGTDAARVRAAIEQAMSPDGVLVLIDLGSALMSAELAVELLGDTAGPVRLSAAPLVEGTVAAAVAASGGAGLDEVAAEARGALAMKASQIPHDAGPDATTTAGTLEVASDELSVELPVLNAIGLHARPAARFVQTARAYDAQVGVSKSSAGGRPVSARSVTNLVALSARNGDTLVVTASGPQAAEALAALRALAESGFGDGTAAPQVPPTTRTDENVAPPRAGTILNGVPASGGIAIGPAHRLRGLADPPPDEPAGDPDTELARSDEALAAARSAIARDREAVAARAGAAEAEIFDAHLALLDDEALTEPARSAILAGTSAERAWHDAAEQVAANFRALPEPLLQERAADVIDVGQRMIAALRRDVGPGAPEGIVVCDELTPADAASLDPDRVLGIAAARGSATAHAVILARALGLPAVVGLGEGVLGIAEGTTLVLDGDGGTVTVDPAPALVEETKARWERLRTRAARFRARAREPAVTRDGTRIDVFANLGSVDEAHKAVALGAEGVGLLRTEFLFLDRRDLPDEEEQAETYRRIAVALEGRPLIVRTLDAGADKPLPAIPTAPEANPFLGVRGIRLALAHPALLATQLRAILRVAAEHPVKVMLPMVATLEEVQAARALLAQARSDTGVVAPLELGIMVEVPAAALSAARLAAHVDFFSLGTNDLAQYTMAAERGDARLSPLLAGPQPAVLRLAQETVAGAAARGCPVGVCGELAGDPAAAILLVGLGVTELSMASALIPEVKAALRGIRLADARVAAREALEADGAAEARECALRLLLAAPGG